MIKKLPLLLSLLSFSTFLYAQKIVNVEGYVFIKRNGEPVNSYPVKIYTDIDDTTENYTVYTRKDGKFSFSWENTNNATKAIIFINNFPNHQYDPVIDTINLNEEKLHEYYITPQNLREFILSGYVWDKNTGQPLKDIPVIICNDKKYCLCEKVKTDSDGFYVDTLLVYYSDTPNVEIRVYDLCENEIKVISHLQFLNYHSDDNNFYICKNDDISEEIDFFYKNYNQNKIVYFSSIVNFEYDSLRWNFGDGNYGIKTECSHEYQDTGNYAVTLKVFKDNKSFTKTKNVQIGALLNVSGKVYANGNEIPNGYVLAVYKKTKTFVPINYAKIKNGNFYFENLMRGQYVFYAIPEINLDTLYFPKYISTYYSDVLNWQNASLYTVQTNASEPEINLITWNEFYYGHNSISLTADKKVFNSNDFVTILLLNGQNQVIDSKYFSRNRKRIIFDNLPDGTYTLLAEIPGMDQVYETVKLTGSEQYSLSVKEIDNNLNFVMSSKNLNITYVDILPNPCTDHIIIRGLTNYNNKTIEIVSVTGQEIIKEKLTNREIDVSHLKTGAYIVKVSDENQILLQTLILKK